jgi:phenylacetate-CoA ligase
LTEPRYWNEAAQTMPADRLGQLQDDRLREAVSRVWEQSPFFRSLWEQAGVAPDDVKGLADLPALPVFRKDDLRLDEAAHPPIGTYRCVGLKGAVRLATSSGTTGRPTFAIWTAHDLEVEYELAARSHWRDGIRPGDVVVNAHPGYLNGGQGHAAGAYAHMGALAICVGPPESEAHADGVVRTLEGLPIDHWRLFPAALARYREAVERTGVALTLPPPEAAGPAAQYRKISAGQECVAYLGSACHRDKGAHVAEDYAVVEVLSLSDDSPVADGERGRLVVTSLGRDNPMVRYDLEDVVRLDSTPCECGETSRRAFWDGRMKDLVPVDGRSVLPIDVWWELPADAEFVLVRRPGQDSLEVRLEGDVSDDLVPRLQKRLDLAVTVTGLPAGALARSGYKAVRVIDE